MTQTFGDPKTYRQTLGNDTVRDSLCENVGAVKLVYGKKLELSDIAVYRLDDEAAKHYRFKEKNEAVSEADGGPNLQYVDVEILEQGRTLQLRLKPNAKNFLQADFIFHFNGINGTAAPKPLDPSVGSGGGPRG